MPSTTKRSVVGTLLAAMMFLAACATPQAGPATEASAGSDEQPATEVHMEDDDHADDEHMNGEDDHEDGDEHAEEDEHMHYDVPEEYEGMTNPFEGDPEAIAAGAELFATNCATCHGETGQGDGPAAAGLDPQPAALGDAEMMSNMTDAYIFWRITEGGIEEPFKSAMPAWGPSFSTDQIWQLVSFLRTLPTE